MALEIVNRYSNLFHAQSYSSQMVGKDDYRMVMEALRWDLERRDLEIRQTEVRVGIHTAWDEIKKAERLQRA